MIRACKKCGFLLGTRPGLKEVDGVCLACINYENRGNINFAERQNWLTEFIKSKPHGKYDCAIAVSGGKDSHMIVSRLVENHGVKNALLITCEDDFTLSKAGVANRKNIAEAFGFDHIMFRNNPIEFKQQTLKGLEEKLNPLGWFERRLYNFPIEMARNLGIKIIFFGENSEYEYGSSTELSIFHEKSTEDISVIYMGAIYPYSISDSLEVAKRRGFKDLSEFDDWYRVGGIEPGTQIDSPGYMVHIWCKFPKFGFQRVSDIACRFVREGLLTKEQGESYIRDCDYLLDPKAKYDFCKTLGITNEFFDSLVEKFANNTLVKKDANGIYKRIDFFS